MDNFDLRKYLAEGKLLNEEVKSFSFDSFDVGLLADGLECLIEYREGIAEEAAFDAEFQSVANQLAATMGKELKNKKAENPGQLDEAIVTSTIAAVLTGNAVLGFVSKMAAKLMKKLNWKKGEDFAEKIHKWAHDNEKSFQEPIRRVLAFFIKDKAKLELVVKAIRTKLRT